MILLNKLSSDNKPLPIIHKCELEKVGKVMTLQEIHEFGLDLLIVYLYYQGGNLISSNDNISNEYPHLIVKNPKQELLYIWVRTEIASKVPRFIYGENHIEIINLARQNNATSLFAGIILTFNSIEENDIPLCGGGYFAQFSGLKAI
jgi:hypothetical protein